MKKMRIMVIVFLILLTSTVYLCTFTVTEREYVIVTQFGKPVKIIKEAGLYFKLPGFIQTVNRLDKRIDVFNTQPIQLLLGDKNPIILNCYICWCVKNPLLFFQSIIMEDIARQKLSDMINSEMGSTLCDYKMENIINTDSKQVKLQEIEEKISNISNAKAKEKYGIEIVSVGIRRINYPSIVAKSVYGRMRAEREKEAKRYRAEGEENAAKIRSKTHKEVAKIKAEAYRKSEIIKGKGDKEAIRIYAEAYGKDPALFEYLKSLEALKDILQQEVTLILSTESEMFRYLNNMEGEIQQKEGK